jgi:hypothetical protein
LQPPPSNVVDQRFVARLSDLAIRLLVPDGEAWLPVKTAPDFGHGGRWRRMYIATLLKASSLQPSPRLVYSGGNPRSGSPRSEDDDMQQRSPPGGIILGADTGRGWLYGGVCLFPHRRWWTSAAWRRGVSTEDACCGARAGGHRLVQW